MDGSKFDRIARQLGGARSRRSALKLLLGAAFGGAAAATLENASAGGLLPGASCSADTDCASNRCGGAGKKRVCLCGSPSDCPAPVDRCQTAVCTPKGACTTQIAVGAPCDDGDPCTTGETCDNRGRCRGKKVHCTPPPACFSIGKCDPALGGCPAPVYLGDGVPCDGGVCWQEACCTPGTAASVCTSGLCGLQPDGCGGTVDCEPCCVPGTVETVCVGGVCGEQSDGCTGSVTCPPCCTAADNSCATDGECCSGVCIGLVCQAGPVIDGATCDSGPDCQSGLCQGGRCCADTGSGCASDGLCCSGICIANTCRAGKSVLGGACDTDSDCEAGACAGGICAEPIANGGACSAGTACASGICADGICCDAACTGQCEACNLAGKLGTCSVVTGAPVGGRTACAGLGTCAGTCDGSHRATCTYPGATIKCQNATCSDFGLTGAKGCDGAGGCTADYQQNATDLCHHLFCQGSTLVEVTDVNGTHCSSTPYGECLGGSCCLDTFIAENGQHFCCASGNLCPQGLAAGTASQCCYSDEICFDVSGNGGYSCIDPRLNCGGTYCNGECCNGHCCAAGTTCVNNVCTGPLATTCTPNTNCGTGFTCVGWTKKTDTTTPPYPVTYEPGTCCPSFSSCLVTSPVIPTLSNGYYIEASNTMCCSTGSKGRCMGSGVCEDYAYWLECQSSFPFCSPRGGFRRL